MKIGIVGSRDVPDNLEEYRIIRDYVLSKVDLIDIDCVISGGCEDGVDIHAHHFAKREEIFQYREYLPQYHRYPGNKGYYVRNKKIVEESDIVFIFWSGLKESRGSKMDIELCLDLGRKNYIYNYKEKRLEEEKRREGILPTRKAAL